MDTTLSSLWCIAIIIMLPDFVVDWSINNKTRSFFSLYLLISHLFVATQATGAAVLEQLQRQRETIQRAQHSNTRISDSINESETILKRMKQWWRIY
jgi:hypothetical protein